MRNMNKKSREILVGLFLGANCLNGMVTNMPVVNMPNNGNQSLLSKNAKQTIGQADIYTAAYNQVVDFVDSTFFGHADADANITSGQVVSGVLYGSTQNVLDGGTSIDCTFKANGTENIKNGGVASGSVIGVRANQNVLSGGIAYSTSVFGGWSGAAYYNGNQYVQAGGTAYETSVDRYGHQTVMSGGVARDNAFLSGEDCLQGIHAGGLAIGNSFVSGAAQVVAGKAIDTVLNGGKQTVQAGGDTDENVINAGGQQDIQSGGLAENNTVNSGGTQNIENGGTAVNNIINNGGTQNIENGGLGINNTIKDGGSQHIFSGGTAENNNIEAGGKETVDAGGVTIGGSVVDNGQQEIGDGGNSLAANVANGGTQIVNSGGNSADANIENGGSQVVNVGGSVQDSNIGQGGSQTVLGESHNSNVFIGGSQVIGKGGVADGTNLEGGQQTIEDGGLAKNAILKGGVEIIEQGGSSQDAVVRGGTQDIKAYGTATGTEVSFGGSVLIENGAIGKDCRVEGGNITLNAGGKLIGTTRLNGGQVVLGKDITQDATEKVSNNLLKNKVVKAGTGQYSIDDLSITEARGSIILGTGSTNADFSAVGRTLTINNLEGSGDFVVNADLDNNKSDKIIVNKATNSDDNTLQVNFDPSADLGKDIDGNTVVMQAPSNVGLTGKEGQIGAYTYNPDLYYKDGNWYLKGLKVLRASETGSDISTAAGIALARWRDGDNNIDRRLYNIRQNSQASGLWAQVDRNDITLNQVNNKGNNYSVGYDVKPGGPWSYGAVFSYGKGDSTYAIGTGDYKDYSLGVYGTWQGQRGHFADVILRGGRLNNTFELSPNINKYRYNGDYSQNAISLSAKFGYHLNLTKDSYLEPYGKLGYGHVTGSNYGTTDGINVNQESGNSLYGKLGVSYGKHFGDKGLVYADLAVAHEFAGGIDTRMESNGLAPITVNSEVKGTWMDINVGYRHNINKKMSWYGNVGRLGMGGDVAAHWNYSMGLTYHF